MGLFKFYKEAPGAGKVMIIAAGVAAAVLGYIAVSQLVRRFRHQQDLKDRKKTVDDSKDAVAQLQNQGVRLSYPEAQYSTLASQIQSAFDGCDPADDDQGAVMNAINQMKNDADMYKLIAAFGVRKWDKCGWWTGDEEMDLAGGVRAELNSNEIAVVNAALANKNISFRF